MAPVTKNPPPPPPPRTTPVKTPPPPPTPPSTTTAKPKPTGPVDQFENGPSGPPPRVEISKDKPVSDADIAELRKQGRGELADAVRDAQKTYADLIAKGAKLSVTNSTGNNGHPVITVVPPALANNKDPNVKYDVQVHYTGQDGTSAKPAGDSQSRARIEDSFKRTPPTVFVLPTAPMKDDAAGTPTPQWRDTVRDTGKTADDGVQGIVGKRGQLTVSAHSFGRKALTEAINRGGLKADRVDVEDAIYPTQPADTQALRKWSNEHPDAKLRISTGMSSKRDIQHHVPKDPFPDAVFSGDFSHGHHWDAELRPWP
jgi:hypothetical protein